MTITEILEQFDGIPLDEERLGAFTRWALHYFHNPKEVTTPIVDMTLQFEITQADVVYRQRFAQTPGASFTAYLIWNLLRAEVRYPDFQYRHIDGKWYHLRQAPVFMPVATGQADRFRDVFLFQAYGKSWSEFCDQYRNAIDGGLGEKQFIAQDKLFYLATIVGNLPYMRFTSLSAQKSVYNSGRTIFYFGQRYTQEGKLFIPLHVGLDHANTDPYVLNGFLKEFETLISNF